MRKSTALVLCCAFIFVAAKDINTKITTVSTTITPSTTIKPTTPPPESTTVPSTTISTTEEPTTTTAAPTTTEEPKTTTSVPITTSAPVTTTPIPGPPKVGKWNITGTDNIIIAQMAIQLDIMYNVTNQQNSTRVVIDIPNDAKANGTFNQYNETMKLSWKSAGVGENFVVVSFKRDEKTYVLSGVEISIEPENLPGSNSTLKLVHKQEHFNTTLGNSYRCVRLQTFNLTRENDTNVLGKMKVSDLQFQAFKTDKKASFGLAEDCAFDTPDVVPIAVGCVLAGLVVIVLVAYLFSRRRSQARGYLSM